MYGGVKNQIKDPLIVLLLELTSEIKVTSRATVSFEFFSDEKAAKLLSNANVAYSAHVELIHFKPALGWFLIGIRI